MTAMPRPAPGFTLLELLVAITVLSLVSLISWRGLESLLATRTRLEPEADEVRAMLTVFGQMELDLAQVANPNFIPLPALPIGAGSGTLQVVRFAPVEADQASALQLVVYIVRDGQLSRAVSAPLRSAALLAQAPLQDATLLSGVRAMQVRVWRTGQGWVDPEAGLVATPDNAMPEGIEVTVERNDGTRVRRVLLTQ